MLRNSLEFLPMTQPSKIDRRLARLHHIGLSRLNKAKALAKFEGQEGTADQDRIAAMIPELSDVLNTCLRLVQNEIIADPHKQQFAEYAAEVFRPGVRQDEFFQINKDDWRWPHKPDPVVDTILSWLAGSTSGMRQEVIYRSSVAAEYANDNGWFMIMDTLTLEHQYRVDPRKVLSTKGWRDYKERFVHKIGMATYGNKAAYRKKKRSDFIGYVGAVEFGEDGDNPHIHVLWFCRNVPEAWKIDPNSGQAIPKRREIDGAKDLWEYGYSTPTCVRTHDFDAWGECGHVWPVDKKKGTPIPRLGPAGAGMYIAKYIDKEKGGQWSTRVRISRNLGMQRAWKFLREQPTRMLRPLSKSSMLSLTNFPNIPHRVVKKLAQKERLSRCSRKLALMCRKSLTKNSLSLVALLRTLREEHPEKEAASLAHYAYHALTLSAGCYRRRIEASLRLEKVPELKFNPIQGFTGYAYF